MKSVVKVQILSETAKFYGIFSVITTRMSIFQATLYGFLSRSCLGCESLIARSRGWFGEGEIANGTMTGKRLVYRLLSELHRGHSGFAAEEIKMNFISYFTTFKRLFKKILHIRIFCCTFVPALEGVAKIVLLSSISTTYQNGIQTHPD